MITLTKGNEVLEVSEIDEYDDEVVLSWGKYKKTISRAEFETYTKE